MRLVAVFTDERDLLAATRAAREAGLQIEDAYTPYCVHGLDQALGQQPTRLPIVCFLCGLFGAAFILWFQFWTSAADWPLNVGGKPFNSLPAFVPVTFEMMVLFGGLGSVLALLVRSRLYPGATARLPIEGVTDDRFALVLQPADASFDLHAATALFREHGAVEVVER